MTSVVPEKLQNERPALAAANAPVATPTFFRKLLSRAAIGRIKRKALAPKRRLGVGSVGL
jgi:hypothetical protein